ncbi:MAG: VWA domain-containing protein [Candidatus Acidiferrales bacterium]
MRVRGVLQSAVFRAALAAITAGVIAIPPRALAQLPTQQQGPIKPPQQTPPTPPPPAQQKQQPQYQITVQSQIVQVNTVVTDQDGNIIKGLKQQNFRVFDEGQAEPITNFQPNTAPITIVILMEFSNAFGPYLAQIGPYLTYNFTDHLGKDDWVALVTYDLKTHIVVDFTHDMNQVKYAISTLFIPGFSESNEFDALIDTLDRLKDVQGKKAILLVSTGADTFSRHTLDQTYNALKQTNVTVFCVNAAEIVEVTQANQPIGYLQAKNEMDYFGKLTGGMSFYPRFLGEMPDDFENIVEFLRNQYSLGYVPPEAARDGKYHKIRVDIVDDKGQPFMLPNKKGKMKKVVVYARAGYLANNAGASD